jgi:proteasome lid subunit RPN8/RPN11
MKLKKAIYDDMIEHCRNCLPYEACGILAGKNNFVTEIYKIKNIEDSFVSYFMEPKEQLKAMKDIRQRGLDMIAIFHSHPFGNAYPSKKDRDLAFYDVYYVIVGFEPKIEVKSFKIKDGEINQEELIIENEN